MRKIAILNQKGGSGKTTTTVNLAAALVERGRKVLVIDLDPQASTTAWYGYTEQTKSLLNVFTQDINISTAITQTSINSLKLIPASTWLIGLEKALAHEVGSELILKRKLLALDHTEWDYILIDCPPTLGILAINALCAVDELIIPVESRIMALSGLVQLLQTVDVIKERLNNALKITGIVACRVDSRTKHSKEIVDELRSKFKDLVFDTIIRENVKLAEAPSFSKPILEYDTESRGALDYRLLAQEVIKQEKFLIKPQPTLTATL
jgi:chromosome partitioning protein